MSGLAGRSDASAEGNLRAIGLQLAGAGIVSLLLGQRWYGLGGIGLRGRRPLYSGIGFAVLGWLAFLTVRFVTVLVDTEATGGGGRMFVHILLFEAFCVQVWAFGLLFRSLADWRGPLTAVGAGAILFGLLAQLFYQESFAQQASFIISIRSFVYFSLWGLLYGVIRLRTGSILGVVLIQAVQSWTAWQLLPAPDPVSSSQLGNLYLFAGILYVVIIWRLWPKQAEDYRV